MQANIQPYTGKEPFLFISYAHKDETQAKSIIQWLDQNNYRLWFDHGIHSGEFASKIEERLENASCLIALLSDHYIDSINCRNEINYAIKNNIMILPIFIKPAQLRHGMSLQLVSYHFINCYQLTESQFYEELRQSPEIQKAHNSNTGNAVPNAPAKKTKLVSKPALGIIFSCILICALCLIGSLINNWYSQSSNQKDEEPAQQNPMNIRNEYSSMTAYDEEIIVETMVKQWKPLAHLGFDVSISEVLSRFYTTVHYDLNTVTAQNDAESIQFSVYWIKNADYSYSISYSNNIFYDCYVNGTPVEAEAFEKYICDLITQMP